MSDEPIYTCQLDRHEIDVVIHNLKRVLDLDRTGPPSHQCESYEPCEIQEDLLAERISDVDQVRIKILKAAGYLG